MNKEKQIVRNWLKFFIAALFLSGLTAIPVERELSYIVDNFPFEGSIKGFLEEVLIGTRQHQKIILSSFMAMTGLPLHTLYWLFFLSVH